MTRKYKKGTYILVPEKNRIRGINANSQLVFMWLCAHKNNDDDTCYPSIKRLQSFCKLSRNTIKNSLNDLEKLGLIKIQHRKRKNSNENETNLYKILIKDSFMGWSNTDLPTSTNNQQVGHVMATNYTQKELKHNNSSFFYSNFSYLENIPENDISDIIKTFGVSRSFIFEKAKDVEVYCNKTGKTYKNYRYALQGFIKKDLEKNGRPKRSGEMKKISDLLPPIKIRDP